MRTELGKITTAYIGMGGYQEVQFGVWYVFGGAGWGVSSGDGVWSHDPIDGTKWTKDVREQRLGQLMMEVCAVLRKAKKTRVDYLVGLPVEVTFEENNRLSSWRLLTEVL